MAKMLIDMWFTNEPIGDDEENSGAFFRDYFDCQIAEAAECDSEEAADAMLLAAYKGPDVDGMGVSWKITDIRPFFTLDA